MKQEFIEILRRPWMSAGRSFQPWLPAWKRGLRTLKRSSMTVGYSTSCSIGAPRIPFASTSRAAPVSARRIDRRLMHATVRLRLSFVAHAHAARKPTPTSKPLPFGVEHKTCEPPIVLLLRPRHYSRPIDQPSAANPSAKTR